MKIKDLSKLDKNENPLEVEGSSLALNRYTTVDNKYYDVSEKISRANNSETSGTIFQNNGIIEKENIEENSIKDFSPVSQSKDGKNYYVVDHPDGVKAEARFIEMKRLNVYTEKGDTNVVNYDETANHKSMIKGGFSGYAANQDENNDDFSSLSSASTNSLKILKNAALSSTNIGGVGTQINDLINSLTNTDETNFDIANEKVLKWKKENYKQIHTSDYKESQYYNSITNLANTQNKLLRGDLGYTASFSATGQNLLAKFGDNDYEEDAEELLDLNLVGQYNMYTAKPGTKVKTKPLESGKDYPVLFGSKAEVSKYREEQDGSDNRINSLSEEIPSFNGKDGHGTLERSTITAFTPSKVSDAQARMIAMLKYRNSYWQTIGCIYVKPFYSSSNGFENFSIPFEFKPEISEGGLSARYQAETLLNRLGAMQIYTGTDLSTLSLTTTYLALAPDDPTTDECGRQHNTNAWEFYWTNNRIEELEWKLRSLVFPALKNGSSGYLVKPPIVQILIGDEDENPTVGTLYKYPNNFGDNSSYSLRSDYIRVSNQRGNEWKKYVVSSIQIDKIDQDIMSYPSLYAYSPTKREGQENDGIAANVYTADEFGQAQLSASSNTTIEYEDRIADTPRSSLGSHVARRRGFKATLQLVEVTENFLDIVPDFRAYYDAAKYLASKADLVSNSTSTLMGASLKDAQDILDSLTADANTLETQSGELEESIKAQLEKAYIIAKNYYLPNEAIFGYYKAIYMIVNDKLGSWDLGWTDDNYKFEHITENASFAKNQDNKEIDSVTSVYNPKNITTITIKDNIIISSSIGSYIKEDKSSKGAAYNELELKFYEVCPFEDKASSSLGYLTNANLVSYLDQYFYNYGKLKSVEAGGNKYTYNYLKKLLSAFEKGGKIFGLTDNGKQVTITTIPSVKTVVSMINNSFTSLVSNYKLLTTSVKSVIPDTSFSENKITSLSAELINNEIVAKINNEGSTLDLNSTNCYKEWIKFITDNASAFTDPITFYTKTALKSAYETIMKPYDNAPATSTIENFGSNYGSNYGKDVDMKSSTVFVDQEYNGDGNRKKGLVNITETDVSKLSGFDPERSVVYLGVKKAYSERSLSSVQKEISEQEENVSNAKE